MQTFLPYPGFRASAAVLDDKRLGKQRVEVFQILRALTWPTYAWKNHPATVMWRGCVPALVAYGLACIDEWEARGRADSTRQALLEFSGGRVPSYDVLRDSGGLPPWLGWDAVHASHQSALVRKEPEFYRAVFPDVPDDLPYLWPGSVFPRWPVRRGGPGLLGTVEALRLVGRTELPRGGEAALAAVEQGEDAEVRGQDGPVVALVAALTRPGRTAWVTPGGELAEEPPAPPRGELVGKVSASIAKSPTPEDLAAMRAEAGADPEVLFLRVHQVGAQPPSPDVTLAVLDGPPDAVPHPGWHLPALRLLR